MSVETNMLYEATEKFIGKVEPSDTGVKVILEKCQELQDNLRRYDKYGTANPVAIAHRILSDCYLEKNAKPMDAIQDAIAYLEEALTE